MSDTLNRVNMIQVEDLLPGDILLKRSEFSMTHIFISIGQKLGGSSKATTVHAAIYIGDGIIAESSGSGLSVNKLNSHHIWKVYRMIDGGELPSLAVSFAMEMIDRGRHHSEFGKYDTGDATKSAFSSGRDSDSVKSESRDFLEESLKGEKGFSRTFFCSDYVVQCYSIAEEFMKSEGLPLSERYLEFCDHKRTSPGDLAEHFEKTDSGWQKIGEIRG